MYILNFGLMNSQRSMKHCQVSVLAGGVLLAMVFELSLLANKLAIFFFTLRGKCFIILRCTAIHVEPKLVISKQLL